MRRLHVTTGDITRQAVDVIVNAANERMLGGGGVDGAIHAAAGPELRDACRAVAEARAGVRCPTGEARITPGFRLPARFVVHTAGPVWRGGAHGERELLVSCYRNALALAASHGAASIAFPAISRAFMAFPWTLRARSRFKKRCPSSTRAHRSVQSSWSPFASRTLQFCGPRSPSHAHRAERASGTPCAFFVEVTRSLASAKTRAI